MNLTIVGNIAAGKSTLMPYLSRSLKAKPVDADNLFQTSDPFAKPFLADMRRWAFINELWLTKERAIILRKAIEAEKKKRKETLLVIDSGLLISWVYTYSHVLVETMTNEEWELYKHMFDTLTHGLLEDTYVIKLNYNITTLMERLKKRGRDYELAFYTREYLGQIELGLTALEEKLKQDRIQIINIDEEEFPDFEHSLEQRKSIVTKVKKQLGI